MTEFGECFIWGRTGNKNHFLPTSIKQLSNKKVLSVTCTLYYTAAFVGIFSEFF